MNKYIGVPIPCSSPWVQHNQDHPCYLIPQKKEEFAYEDAMVVTK